MIHIHKVRYEYPQSIKEEASASSLLLIGIIFHLLHGIQYAAGHKPWRRRSAD